MQSVLDRAPEERGAFLDQACAGDEGLRREVESLIIAHNQASGFIETPAMEVDARVIASEARLAAGGMVNHYRIVELLGAGGMGEVYLAVDTRVGRKVALKVLSNVFTGDEARIRRFQQEARAASALNHPNIITIHEVGRTDSLHLIVTELIEGETLRERLAKKLKLQESLDISIQIADALLAAHEAGIVHRDIKPENVMIRPDGYVKVLDFGLAKLIEQPVMGEAVDTQAVTKALVKTDAGTVMGTVAYMSPEQASGGAIDARSDLWSLGVVLYEMVAGQRPFDGKTPNHIIVSIIEEEPISLSRHAGGAPEELERIVTKALTKDCEERYQTAKDLLIDLRRLKKRLELDAELKRVGAEASEAKDEATNDSPAHDAGVGVATTGGRAASAAGTLTAQPVTSAMSSVEYIVHGVGRHKTIALIALAALVIAAASVAYLTGFTGGLGAGGKAIESLAVLPLVNTAADPETEYLSDGITESLIKSLSQLPHMRVMSRNSVFRFRGRETDAQAAGRALGVQAVLTGRVTPRGDMLLISVELVDARDNTHLWGEQYNRKLTDLISLQNEITRDVSQKLGARLSGADERKLTKNYTENTEAYQAYLKGRYFWNKGIAPDYGKSRDYFQQAIEIDPTYALAYAGLADYYGFSSANGFLPPDENWRKAEAATNKALELDDTLAEAYNPLAAVKLYYRRDWRASEQAFKRGIELNPNFAEIRHHYGLRLVSFGRNEEALAEMGRAIELDPLSTRFNLNRARLLFFMREYDRAIDQFHKTLELDRNFAPAHEWLGNAYEQKGMYTEAVAAWSKALTLRGEAEQAAILERAYAASGFEQAVRALAQQRLERVQERTKRGEYVAAFEYLTAYTRMGDKEQAFAWLAKVVEERNGFALEIEINPIYDSLRDDPRFQGLLRRMNVN